jgi:hypothetical protein
MSGLAWLHQLSLARFSLVRLTLPITRMETRIKISAPYLDFVPLESRVSTASGNGRGGRRFKDRITPIPPALSVSWLPPSPYIFWRTVQKILDNVFCANACHRATVQTLILVPWIQIQQLLHSALNFCKKSLHVLSSFHFDPFSNRTDSARLP